MDKQDFICKDNMHIVYCELCGKTLGIEPQITYRVNDKIICHNCMGWIYDTWCKTGQKAEKHERKRILKLIDNIKVPEVDYGSPLDMAKVVLTNEQVMDIIKKELKQKIEE